MIATFPTQWPSSKSALFRHNMVDRQLRTNRVFNHQILQAMNTVVREDFVPEALRNRAYSDEGLAFGQSRYMLGPAVLARLIQAVDPSFRDKVLYIGCLTGYGPAVLSQLAGTVIGLESNPSFAAEANRLTVDKFKNIAIVQGDLCNGYVGQAPFDIVFFEGSVNSIPQKLFDQLGNGGRLIAVVGGTEGGGTVGVATLFMKIDGVITQRALFDCGVPALPGFSQKPAFIF